MDFTERVKVSDDIVWVGADDAGLEIFESQYPVRGISYNSYVILDESIAVMDTVDKRGTDSFFENLQKDYFPFKVEGDCLYGANRTADGWWLWVFNNKGVTKFTDAPHAVDHSFDAVVSVSCGNVDVASIRELITERDVPAAAGAFTHRVAAGDLAVFEIAAAK